MDVRVLTSIPHDLKNGSWPYKIPLQKPSASTGEEVPGVRPPPSAIACK